MDTIVEDFERFSHLHSYYKHYSPNGTKFSMIRSIGQEPRNNGCDHRVVDKDNLHWWFYEHSICEKLNLPTNYTITINCFTRGLEKPTINGQIHLRGFNIIRTRWDDYEQSKELSKYVEQKYPELFDKVMLNRDKPSLSFEKMYENDSIKHIFATEKQNQLQAAIEMAKLYEQDVKNGKIAENMYIKE